MSKPPVPKALAKSFPIYRVLNRHRKKIENAKVELEMLEPKNPDIICLHVELSSMLRFLLNYERLEKRNMEGVLSKKRGG